MNKYFKAISLFSGAGGMDQGVSRAGFRILFANDANKDACESFRLNHGTAIRSGDIMSTDVRHEVPQHGIDLIFGGPPCQGFSVAGKMQEDDERNALIWRFFEIVNEIRPASFICENVKALATSERWRSVREALMTKARRDYRVALVVLLASDFGVPQKRERMFLIGLRKDLTDLDDTSFTQVVETGLEEFHRAAPTVGSVITLLGRAGSPTNPATCSARITFARNPILRPSAFAGSLFNGAGRPIDINHHAPTLTATMGGNRTPIIDEGYLFDGRESFIERYHQHLMQGGSPRQGEAPSCLRRLTLKEALLLQGFPEDYKLVGSRCSQYRQIGNAVPPPMAEAISVTLRKLLSQQATTSSLNAA